MKHPKHGPLPVILLLLTAGTGVMDAVSILGLGRVFVANMTGNIVFIGFALAGAPGFFLLGSVLALVASLNGAAGGGGLIARFSNHRGHLLRNGTALRLVLLLIALVVASLTRGAAAQLVVLGGAGLALGVQNSVVRHLAVPDMTTTVLTLTGIAADLRHRDLRTARRRTFAVLGMLTDAPIGALLVLRLDITAGLTASVLITATAFLITGFLSSGTLHWAITS